mgnify:CR=1 FL=1
MEILYVSLGIVVLAVIMGIIAIRNKSRPKGNDKCMNCGKATPINGVCPRCHYNERTQKLEP